MSWLMRDEYGELTNDKWQGYQKNLLRNNCARRLLNVYFDRYMFRPSLAIIRWNTQYNIKKLLFLQRIRCLLYKLYCARYLANAAVVYLNVIARYLLVNVITN
jgi:hypothetical protein